ncbi:hypothetical protein GCQ56_08025 [Marinifilum sp. N1E240]|uniref:phospholipase effector Tle1 domain-containing protein n=1 Tax=Marinifilum sp. N1E240 TaxID=2608082 RepID=UPI00128B1EBF|nr:DUF2235 domain-containing protein [Marinifilum sp. N1E240]MPQ46962.1 hypothetical protein [Marinifilum sp. N1E240]
MKIKMTDTYVKDFDAPAKKRKHIILLDGTWNDETGSDLDGLVTNIVKLRKILVNSEENQIVRYHRGVGNDNDNGWLGNLWKGSSGNGVQKIVEHAYIRFVKDWQKGDEIFIFGFSRGAAAARLLASKISKKGVPKSVSITLFARENKQTKVAEQHIANYSIENGDKSEAVKIEFLGVWDTVSAFGLYNNFKRFIGISKKDLFTDNHIAPNIKKAVHLVGIDETRNPFTPSLMNHKEGVTHEVWFPGVHSDIGGSYREDEIAKVSLNYMIQMMKNHIQKEGLKALDVNTDHLKKFTLETSSKAHFHFHGLSWGENLRLIRVQENGETSHTLKPKIHQLYYDLCESNETFAAVKKRKSKKCVPFQYMPFNVKALRGEFEIVKPNDLTHSQKSSVKSNSLELS